MKRGQMLACGVVAGVLVTLGGPNLSACGDKFLVVSRGTRFQRAAPLRNATILLYANPASGMPQMIGSLSADATLKKAGYRPTTVSSADEFDKALARGGWNLVVADVADMPSVQPKLRGVAALAVVPSSDDIKNAKRQYQCVLKSPTRTQALLDAVDEALSTRPKSSATGRTN